MAEGPADILRPKGPSSAAADAAEAPKDPLKDLMAAVQKVADGSLATQEARAEADAKTYEERKGLHEEIDVQLAAIDGGAIVTAAQEPAAKPGIETKPAAVAAQEPAAQPDQAPADAAGKQAEATEGEVKVTRALRKAAVAALEDSFPDAKKLVDTIAARSDGGKMLQQICDDPKAALAVVESVPDKADFAAMAKALIRKKEGVRDEKNKQEKLADIDGNLSHLEKLNPEFAKQANAAYDRYAAEQKAKNDALAARGEKPVEPMDRRDYLSGAYVAAAGVFLAGVPDSSRAEAKAAIDALHASNPDGVARFLREVDPGTNEKAAKSALESYSKSAGVNMDATDAKPAGTVEKGGVTVKVSKKGDTTIEEWPDGKTVYVGKDGESVENDGGRVTRKNAKGEVVARFTKENPTVSWVGRTRYPVSNAGKTPDQIAERVNTAKKWDDFAVQGGFPWLPGGALRFFEGIHQTVPSSSYAGGFQLDATGTPLGLNFMRTVAKDLEFAVGLEEGAIFDRSNGFRMRLSFIDMAGAVGPENWLRNRFLNGWKDKDGVQHSGPGSTSPFNRSRLAQLVAGKGGDGGKADANPQEGKEGGVK